MPMTTGLQFTGNLAANQTQRFFTSGWNPAQHVVWYMMPVTPKPGAAELQWSVGVERADATQCTYWITVTNLTSTAIAFEGRYAILS
jgi:hypothetical protein